MAASLFFALVAAFPATAKPPVLVVLAVAEDEQGKERETRLVGELGLVLEGLAIRVVDPEGPDFTSLPLAGQIERVRPLVERHGAVAATWLAAFPPDSVLLTLVAVSTGRALVRVVETELQSGSETYLALATRELLGTAYLFEPPPARAMEDVVDSVREQVAPGPPQHGGREWATSAALSLDGGLVGQQGASLAYGAGARLERRLAAGLRGRLSVAAHAGPLVFEPAERIQGWTLTPGLGLFYGWEVGPVELGPSIDVQVAFSSLTMTIGNGPRSHFSAWNLRGTLGFDLRWFLTSEVALFAGIGLGATPQQEVYRRRSDDSVLLATPFVHWGASVGILLLLSPDRA